MNLWHRPPASWARWALAILALGTAPQTQAQVFAVGGGTSTLYQSQGGTITYRSPANEASFGAGISANRFLMGGHLTHYFPKNGSYTVGQQFLQVNFPTDIFNGDHFLETLGVTLQRKVHNTDATAFAGELSLDLASPYFGGADTEKAAAALLLNHAISRSLTAVTELLVSSKSTALQSIGWAPSRQFAMAATGGIGANAPYGALSLSETRERFTLKAAYIQASKDFLRAPAGLPVTAEPIRENILLTVAPLRRLTLSASRQNFLTPASNSNFGIAAGPQLRSAINSAAANLSLTGTQLSATVFQSRYNGYSNMAMAYSAARNITANIHAQASYLTSRSNSGESTDTLTLNVLENLSPRLSISEQVNDSAGQTTLGMGGSFFSNLATISATYQTYYVPTNTSAPFQNNLMLDVQFNLFGRLQLHASNYIAPSGKVLYSADARTQFSKDFSSANPGAEYARSVGAMQVCGHVVNQAGTPVDGAALMIDETPVYTDTDGHFCMREKKSRVHALKILDDQFLDGIQYHTVKAPPEVQSEPAQSDKTDVLIVVAKNGREHGTTHAGGNL